MSSIQNVTQGINADILTNMKASKKILNKVAEDRQNAATESKEYFKEVINQSTEIKENVAKGINVDVTVWYWRVKILFTLLTIWIINV